MSATDTAPARHGFTRTLADWQIAGNPRRTGAPFAAARLPLSEYAEERRAGLPSRSVAMKWREEVSHVAHDLREALEAHEAAARANGREDADDATDERERVAGMEAADAARALLRMLGES